MCNKARPFVSPATLIIITTLFYSVMAFDAPTDTATEPQAQLGAPATLKPTQGVQIEAVHQKWPGWPGDNVFRLIVPVIKVGTIIGRKGESIKKLCDQTGARVRVLDGPITSPHRVVLISGKEELEAELSPAMVAVMRLTKQINGLPKSDEDDANSSGVAAVAFCVVHLLVASGQAFSLIGKQGATIKSIQERSGAPFGFLQVFLWIDEVAAYANSDERVVELEGEAVKVIKAVESVVGHLRKFLVDHSVLPLFEKSHKSISIQATTQDGVLSNDYPLSVKRDQDSVPSLSGLSYYGKGTAFSGISSSGHGSIITQVAQTMQIPLIYAENIIGIGGSNISYIRRTSGAVLTVQESMGVPDQITVEIKGTSLQVQVAQQLIQACLNKHNADIPRSYGFPSTSLGSHQNGLQYPYGSSGLGGYSSYMM